MAKTSKTRRKTKRRANSRGKSDPLLRFAGIGADGSLSKNLDEVLYGNHQPSSELVFAYGSNMAPGQMRDRCPSSDLTPMVASAKGWSLCFPRRSKIRKSGVASIRPASKEKVVWGVVLSVTKDDLQRLDGFEGVNSGSYSRARITVTDKKGYDHKVWTYFAIAEGRKSIYKPSKEYLGIIIEGARYHRLPDDYIGRLKRIAST